MNEQAKDDTRDALEAAHRLQRLQAWNDYKGTLTKMTETQLLNAVCDLAATFGWRVMHPRPANTTKGWRTPVQGVGSKGWPDLVLVSQWPARFIVRELKTDAGRLTPEQVEWLELLERAGVNAGVWRPRDWDDIVATLTHGRGR